MSLCKFHMENQTLVVELEGTIDSTNAADLENSLNSACDQCQPQSVVLDFAHLMYTSSAGLRVILRLRQRMESTRIINASPEVYDVLSLTGFTEMMDVQKAYRVISVEGCEVIGQGANGKVYRIDPDTIVKVFFNPDSLHEINRERELARTAFVAGLPTAIPYDVVRVEGGGYGSVFELLNAVSYAKLLITGQKTVDEIAAMSVSLLKLIHSKTVKSSIVPDAKTWALDRAWDLQPHLPAELHAKLISLISEVPDDPHLIHGDYHIKNVMLQNGESLLIDMDTLSHGHPVFEFASIYNAYCGFSAVNPMEVMRFLGIPRETSVLLWKKMLALYLDTDDPAVIRDVEDKVMILSAARIMRRTIRRAADTEDGRAMIAYCRGVLEEKLPKVYSLAFC